MKHENNFIVIESQPMVDLNFVCTIQKIKTDYNIFGIQFKFQSDTCTDWLFDTKHIRDKVYTHLNIKLGTIIEFSDIEGLDILNIEDL